VARSRNIKPGFFTNEYLSELPPLARLLFIGLWCYADREGRLEDRPKRLKVDILPYDSCNIDDLLNKLAESPDEFIVRYEIDDRRYIQISNFHKHQNPHVKEPVSTIPEPYLHRACTIQAPEQSNRESVIGNQESVIGNSVEKNLFIEIINYLNLKAGTSYKHTSQKTRDLIKTRIKEKFTLDNFFTVIDKKTSEWKGTDNEKYLRPETLFGTKFEGYLNQKIITKKSKVPQANNFSQRQYEDEFYDNLYEKIE